MMRSPRNRTGFTLLELLVVIAILTLLIGILMPSMHRAKLQARDTQCRIRLRAIHIAHMVYLHDNKRFAELNNDEDDGTWQYNYLIYDGRDFDSNFGPLLNDTVSLDSVEQLFCPRQTDPYHTLATPENPWPVVPLLDTRSAYARRYHLTGRSLSQMKRNPALFSDVFHLPKVVKSAHGDGVNVAYLDGHVQFVRAKKLLTDNDLAHPFAVEDNPVIEDIWDELNRARK